jgi:hypothetical protein
MKLYISTGIIGVTIVFNQVNLHLNTGLDFKFKFKFEFQFKEILD